jgi:hypothetical protein
MVASIRFIITATTALLPFFLAQVQSQSLGDWAFCSSSSQCRNGCCSKQYSSDGKLKCTPLTGGYNPSICVGGSSAGGSGLGDWAFCSSNSQCSNGCCSSKYSNDGKTKCTPLSGGFNANICTGAGGGSTGGGTASLYSGSGSGTFYYDVTGRSCSGPSYAENQGYPTCTSFDPAKWKKLSEYGTNKIVAIDNTLLQGQGRANLCGKQIQVFKDGVEVPGGPFVVFDGCEACIGGSRIDFSLSALDQIDNGNACRDGLVPGISWKVTNNQIIPFIP